MNEITRLEYVKDCNVGVTRWNMGIKRAGVDFELKLPSTRFRRAGRRRGPASRPTPRASRSARPSSTRRRTTGCPAEADIAFVKSLMQRVTEPGKMAGWIAPPDRGINAQPVEYAVREALSRHLRAALVEQLPQQRAVAARFVFAVATD